MLDDPQIENAARKFLRRLKKQSPNAWIEAYDDPEDDLRRVALDGRFNIRLAMQFAISEIVQDRDRWRAEAMECRRRYGATPDLA